MKLWEKVNNITGNGTKARFLVEYINAGSKFILSSLPEKFLWSVTSEQEILGWNSTGTNIIGNGSDISYDKIIAVYRYEGAKRRVAKEISDKFIHSTDESDSLSFPTKMFPVYYKLNSKIFIKPDPDYNNYSDLTDASCDTVEDSTNVSIDSTSSLQVGMKVSGSGIPSGTTIESITNSTTFVISSAATATATDITLTFSRVYTTSGGSIKALNYTEGDKGVVVYSAPPIIDENTENWVLTEFENVALYYAASLDMLRLSNVSDAEKILEGGYNSSDSTSKTSLSAIHWLEDEDPEMATAVIQVSQGDLSLANQRLQQALSYYQKAVAELRSITGALAMPEEQQQAQREPQGMST